MTSRLLHRTAAALLTLGLAGCAALPPVGLPAADAGAGALASRSVPDPVVARLPAVLARDAWGLRVAELPYPTRDKLATVLTYRAMDNDVGGGLAAHLNDFERAGSSAGANLVAFSDGPDDGDSRLHYLVADRQPALASPYVGADLLLTGRASGRPSELNSADPETLRRFLSWGYSRYPGRFKVLDVASHGVGYRGICADDRSGYALMSLPDFSRAIDQGLKGRKLDVLNLMACLMSSLEVAVECRDVAKVLVASEDVIMGNEVMTYGSTLAALSERQVPTAQELGRQLVIAANPTNPGTGTYTLAAIDLEQVAALKTAVNNLCQALLRALPAHKAEVQGLYDATPLLKLDQGMSSHRDLFRFCGLLQARPVTPAVAEAAAGVRAALRRALIHSKVKGEARRDDFAVSVYMPTREEAWDPAYDSLRFARETLWDEVLKALR